MTEPVIASSPAMAKAQFGAPAAVWLLPEQQRHDFPASTSYLSLVAGGKQVAGVVRSLSRAPASRVKAKDIVGAPAQMADGYHRLCASCGVDENTEIPVVIARWP